MQQLSKTNNSESTLGFSRMIALINRLLHKIQLCEQYSQSKPYFDILMKIHGTVSHMLFVEERELPTPLDIFRYDCERLDDEWMRRYLFVKIKLGCYSIFPNMPEYPIINLEQIKNEESIACPDLEIFLKQYPAELSFEHWQKNLSNLRNNSRWNYAISYMISAVQDNPTDIDCWLFAQETIITTLLDEEYDESLLYEYRNAITYLFKESYKRFYTHTEYLFFIANILYRATWLIGISNQQITEWRKEAYALEPTNYLYKWAYLVYYEQTSSDISFLKRFLNPHTHEYAYIQNMLKKKNFIGQEIWDDLLTLTEEIVP